MNTAARGGNQKGKADGKTAPTPTPEPHNQNPTRRPDGNSEGRKHPRPSSLFSLSSFQLASVAPKSQMNHRSEVEMIESALVRSERNNRAISENSLSARTSSTQPIFTERNEGKELGAIVFLVGHLNC